MADIELLNKAIESFNSASATLTHYYKTLEDKVELLTEEVEHKKRLLNSILDSIDVGVVFFDKQGIIRLVNSAAERLLSVKSDKIIGGSSLRAEIADEMGARLPDRRAKMLKILPEKGRPFYALVSNSSVNDSVEENIGHVLIFKDITRLKQLEAENERNARLSAMGELVLKIAHEIRNPLGSIELFANLISRDLKDTAQGDYANRISNSVKTLVNTLDNMLRFSKEIKLRRVECLLNDVVDEICREFRELFSGSSVRLEFIEHGHYSVYADKGLLRQAFINILLNSVQAMPDGGNITVAIRYSEVIPSAIEILIRDNGSGMDNETLSKIFEPFFSTKDRGTGLGLSITSGIIAAHEGSIGVMSRPGAGTEFTISLPELKKNMNGII
ncbi:MAG TPA: ATP-binding protein [Dissulfurispiraceae bacterium]|nr:ATP-binding protein [Dissulfurispiraceae bacterium]